MTFYQLGDDGWFIKDATDWRCFGCGRDMPASLLPVMRGRKGARVWQAFCPQCAEMPVPADHTEYAMRRDGPVDRIEPASHPVRR